MNIKNIDELKFVLILTVEGKDSINNKLTDFNLKVKEPRNFEQESINSIKAWRKKGGILKDIPIFVHCPSLDISQETKEEYTKLNVFYLHYPMNDINDFDYGFINVHYSGKLFSDIIDADIFIHIDLDMELLQPLPLSVFDPILKDNKGAIIGGYQPEDYIDQRTPLFGPSILNTDFIITTKQFGKTLYNSIIDDCIYLNNNRDILQNGTEKEFRIYDIEEYGADLTYSKFKDFIFIITEDLYEQGEGYYNNTTKNLPYFWHEHITKHLNKEFFLQKRSIIKLIEAKNEQN